MLRGSHRALVTRVYSDLGKAALALLWCFAGGACHRQATSTEQPAPSSSAITLGIALGACTDLPVCERECDAGSADRCRRLAAASAFGEADAAKDESHAAALYEHACVMNDPSSCMFAGQMSEYARGVTKDDAKAVRLYRRACDLRWVAGCYNLALMYERGTGVPRDEQKAYELYAGACDAGALTSCEKAEALKERPLLEMLDGGKP
jgi:TPR repeat protein